MHKYVEYFTQGSNQALALFAVAILWLSMTCVGAWISGKERVIAADIVSGWALITLISPIFVWILLTKISGVPMLEAAADHKWGGDPEYEAYKASTPRLLPKISKRAN